MSQDFNGNGNSPQSWNGKNPRLELLEDKLIELYDNMKDLQVHFQESLGELRELAAMIEHDLRDRVLTLIEGIGDRVSEFGKRIEKLVTRFAERIETELEQEKAARTRLIEKMHKLESELVEVRRQQALLVQQLTKLKINLMRFDDQNR